MIECCVQRCVKDLIREKVSNIVAGPLLPLILLGQLEEETFLRDQNTMFINYLCKHILASVLVHTFVLTSVFLVITGIHMAELGIKGVTSKSHLYETNLAKLANY